MLSIFIFFSCAKTTEQEVDSAKQSAKYYLTNGECSKARDALQDVGNQEDDQIYISLLASTYACEADYSELDLVAELGLIDSSGAGTMGSLVLLSTSNETQADSNDYVNLFTAIETLLDSGGGTAANRISHFGSFDSEQLHFQSLLLILTELGKFFAYYGNSDSGVKGDGSGANNCIFEYQDPDAVAYVDASADVGACDSSESGHPDLAAPATGADTQRRLCEGIYLFNHLVDILVNVDVSSSPTFSDLDGIGANLETAIDTAVGVGGAEITTVRNILTMVDCQALGAKELEEWYSIVFETLFP